MTPRHPGGSNRQPVVGGVLTAAAMMASGTQFLPSDQMQVLPEAIMAENDLQAACPLENVWLDSLSSGKPSMWSLQPGRPASNHSSTSGFMLFKYLSGRPGAVLGP